uniref:Retrotransposon protein n=1 Tax=Heterorhabditis bacteriophora TaxID=37862 RepID=A0A1I7WPY0_HETBA
MFLPSCKSLDDLIGLERKAAPPTDYGSAHVILEITYMPRKTGLMMATTQGLALKKQPQTKKYGCREINWVQLIKYREMFRSVSFFYVLKVLIGCSKSHPEYSTKSVLEIVSVYSIHKQILLKDLPHGQMFYIEDWIKNSDMEQIDRGKGEAREHEDIWNPMVQTLPTY